MLKYYQSGYFTRTLLLIILGIAMWLPSFLMPAELDIPQHPAPLFQLFLSIVGYNVYVHLFIALIISMATGLLLNQMATEFGITARISQLALLMYILLSTSLISHTLMSPLIVVNFLMLFVVRSLFRLNETSNHIPLVLNAAMLTSITSLFYFPAALYLTIIWLSFFVFRIVKWRIIVVSIVGFLLPYLYAFTWYYWVDQTQEAYSLLLSSMMFHFPDVLSYSVFDAVLSIIILAFILVSVVRTNNSLMEKNINIRQLLIVGLNYLVLSIAMLLFLSESKASSLLICIPGALILSSTLTDVKNTKWYEWGLRLILLLIVINHYSSLFHAS